MYSVGGNREKVIDVFISSKDLVYSVFSFVLWNVRYIVYSVDVISERLFFIFVDSVLSVCIGCIVNGDIIFVVF